MPHHSIVLIPAYQPESSFLPFLRQLKAEGFELVVVNDGSDPAAAEIFRAASQYAVVLHHPQNKGKGAALKTGLAYIQDHDPDAVIICADADGQHALCDIKRLKDAAAQSRSVFWIGSRTTFNQAPWVSRIGNACTRRIYQWASGVSLQDTQTGLRAFDAAMIPHLLSIDGERYEYEMNQLLQLPVQGIPIREVPIQTIYMDRNASSHFHRIKDSFRIYGQILKFAASSLVSFLADFLLYSLFLGVFSSMDSAVQILLSNGLARILSSLLNFSINRSIVFQRGGCAAGSLLKYFSLAAVILIANTALLTLLCEGLGWNKLVAKLIVEMVLFSISYTVQRTWVFHRPAKEETI